ncbi:MAG: hypothetical protein Q9190_007488 [Brigantiaea leucoxantha]
MQPTPDSSPNLKPVDAVKPIPSSSKASAPNTRACQACRLRKVRCLPAEPNPTGQCRRCILAGRQCVTIAPSQRRRRKRTDTRVAELEKIVKELSEKLEQGKFNTQAPQHESTPTANDRDSQRRTHIPSIPANSSIKSPSLQHGNSPNSTTKPNMDSPVQLAPSNTPTSPSDVSLTPGSNATEYSEASPRESICSPALSQANTVCFLPHSVNIPNTPVAEYSSQLSYPLDAFDYTAETYPPLEAFVTNCGQYSCWMTSQNSYTPDIQSQMTDPSSDWPADPSSTWLYS